MAEVDAGAVAPVVPVTPVTEVTPEPDSTAEPEGEEKPVAPERTFTQKEVDDIVSKRAAQAERRALKAAHAAETEYLRKQLETVAPKPPAQGEAEPDPKDYTDFAKFNRDLIRWEIQQETKAAKDKSDRETTTQRDQREMADRARYVHETIVSKGTAKYADFVDVTTADGVLITEPMLAAASRLKNGSDAIYHLGQNPDESARIANLPPVEQAWEMRDLGTKLATPPKPTQAPAPIRPNGGSAAGSKPMLELTQDEFEKRRLAYIAKKK